MDSLSAPAIFMKYIDSRRHQGMESIKLQRRRVSKRSCHSGTITRTPKECEDSVDKVLRPVFILAKCIAIPYFERQFVLLDWRALVSCIIGACNAFLALISIKSMFDNGGITFPNVGHTSFYVLTTTYFFLFLRMSLNWPSLRDEWIKMEAFMVGLPQVNACTIIAAVTVLYTLLGILEHGLSLLDVTYRGEEKVTARIFFQTSWLNLVMWMKILLLLINVIIAIIWNFSDIFLITISIALSARLKQLHLSLQGVMGQDMTVDFWRQSRQRYHKISALTKVLSEELSLLLLLSLSNNLYAICLMLLRTLKKGSSIVQYAYYLSSLTLVFLRVFGVCIAAAKINEISRGLLPIMFAVSSNSYNPEVHRFILEVKDDDLALNCWKFFKVTRNLFLNVAGTIVTYEVVLVQLEGLKY